MKNVDKNKNSTDSATNKDSTEVCLSTIKLEYEYILERSNKLDNKIYIALTVYGFIFLYIIELINKLGSFKYKLQYTQMTLIILYIISIIILLVTYIYSAIILIKLLRGVDTYRISSDFIVKNQLYNEDERIISIYIFAKYTESINTNNKILQDKYIKYNKCIKNLTLIFLTVFFASLLKLFIY